MNKKNVIYLCCVGDTWNSVISSLKSDGIEPAYIVHWRDDLAHFSSFESDGCHLQTVEDAWRGKGFPNYSARDIFDESMLKKLAWYEIQALKMMDRLDPTGFSFAFSSRQYFFRDLVGYWANILENKDIKTVISPSVPHRVFDYALYVACQYLKVDFLSFQMTPFGSNSILINDVNSMPLPKLSNNLVPSDDIVNKIEAIKQDYNNAKPDYMKQHEKNNKSILSPVVVKLKSALRNLNTANLYKFKSPNTYWTVSSGMPFDKQPNWFEYFKISLSNALKIRDNKKLYNKLVEQSGSYKEKFVFVALHYQPEETTCPTGGAYVDQILMIQLLHSFLPTDVDIVVKEHKSQFYNDQEGAVGRNSLFYSRISSISSRIHFESIESDPFTLIDKSLATITVSGTIGWESAIRGTPVLTFGRAWYDNMPRVFKVKTKADLAGVWELLVDTKQKDLHADILKFHANLETLFVKATHYKAVLGLDDISKEDSKNNLINLIKNYEQYFERSTQH